MNSKFHDRKIMKWQDQIKFKMGQMAILLIYVVLVKPRQALLKQLIKLRN